jgi:hypothetical protein
MKEKDYMRNYIKNPVKILDKQRNLKMSEFLPEWEKYGL